MMTLYTIGAAVFLAIAALLGFYRKGGQNALAKRDAAQGKANAEMQKKFDKIDANKPDVDSAIERLSKRAGRNDKPDA